MNLLLVLLSVLTFTVETKNSVTMTGDGAWPYDISVTYDCSFQTGHVRAGDVATLTLGNLGGMAIEQIEVYVKSNKDAGAGTFEVQANGETVSTKSGTLKNWVGMFDNVNYYPISLLQTGLSNVQNLMIRLTGTTSSLYIEKFVITYGTAPARTITLMDGEEVYGTLKEEAGGQGVMLPSLESLPTWLFIGWTETPFESDYTALSSFYRSGMKYYPHEDATLWAVYEYQPEPRVYATELVSGDYIYLNSIDSKAMCGVPDNGLMEVSMANIEDVNQNYSIVFNATGDSATIFYTAQGTYIGYSGSKLVTKECMWAVFHEGNKTAFHITINGKTYVLFPGMIKNSIEVTGLFQTNDVTQSPTAILSTEPLMEEPWYSCFPQRLKALENTTVKTNEIIVPFGIYELRIRDGHKRLRLR